MSAIALPLASDEPEVPQGFELIGGELVEKQTSAEHGRAQLRFGETLSPFNRRSGGPPERPGGWWFGTEVLVQFGPQLRYRPDVAGWRRERLPTPPTGEITQEIPDWICEILSPGNARNDTVRKMRDYHRVQVAHYWLLDPRAETLEVHRWTREGYLVVLAAERGERVRAEPFEGIELAIGVFFGDED